MSKQQFEYFVSVGIKVNPIDFTVLPISGEFADPDQNEPVRLLDIPAWDIDEIVKSMGDSDKERFMALLFKAVRKLS
jgi:hypothetical protein